MLKRLMAAAMWAASSAAISTLAQAQTADPASPAKKELVARVLELQRPAIEAMSRTLAELPARQLMQQAGAALQNVPAERREVVAREIEADVRKYVEEATPIVRERAVKLAPSTLGVLLEERFSEDELRQVIALLTSPVNRKFQEMLPEMQRAIGEKLVAETRAAVEPKVRVLEQSVARRLGLPATAGAASSATKK